MKIGHCNEYWNINVSRNHDMNVTEYQPRGPTQYNTKNMIPTAAVMEPDENA